jgi:branched-chain amino acid transport system substrate-binding protein
MRRPGLLLRLQRSLTALATASIIVTSCTAGGDSGQPASIVTTTTEVTPPRLDDGVLTLGALVPSGETGIGALITSSLEGAIEVINKAGGVLGNDVELLTADEGQSPVSASQAIEELLEQGVDAIIGPTSSNSAIGALDKAVAAGVVTCSATATAIALDDFPDDGLFFRSIATDSLQATAIAREVGDTGAGNVAILHVDDAYGRPYAEAVADALGDDIAVTTIPIPVDYVDLDDDIDTLGDTDPQVVVIVGNSEDSARLLEAMGQRDDLGEPSIIVNDAVRGAASRPTIAGLPSTLRDRVVVIAPQVVLRERAGANDDPPFGPQVTDCVNLLALSAIQGDSDSPEVIAGQMASVSDGGAQCEDFATCALRLADDQEIDYDGPTGLTDLGRDGDPSRAFFDRFRFGPDGSDIFVRRFAVGVR